MIAANEKSEEERIREIIYNSWGDLGDAAKQIYTEIIEPKEKRISELEKENEKLKKSLKP
jgi:hypothetical protein